MAKATIPAEKAAETPRTTIPELPGINVEDGLRRMLNRVALYEKVLRDFHERFAGETERICEALSATDIELAARRAHSLKGTGGMIGATTLATLAAELEQAIRARSPELAEYLDRFDHELRQVLAGIESAFRLGPADGET